MTSTVSTFSRPVGRTLAGLVAGFFALQAAPASAMGVSPAVVEMASAGAASRSTIQVVNSSSVPLPVELQVARLELDAQGNKKEIPAGDEFLIFPPQAMVPPGATQVFRVQWVGNPVLAASQSYFFSVNQVPVKRSKNANGVQVVFNFATIVNVRPPQGQSVLALVGTSVGKDDSGRLRPAVTVENPSNVHAKLSDATVRLSAGQWSKTLRPVELQQALGLGLVQPGKRRRFLMPVELPAGVKQVVAEVDYRPAAP